MNAVDFVHKLEDAINVLQQQCVSDDVSGACAIPDTAKAYVNHQYRLWRLANALWGKVRVFSGDCVLD